MLLSISRIADQRAIQFLQSTRPLFATRPSYTPLSPQPTANALSLPRRTALMNTAESLLETVFINILITFVLFCNDLCFYFWCFNKHYS